MTSKHQPGYRVGGSFWSRRWYWLFGAALMVGGGIVAFLVTIQPICACQPGRPEPTLVTPSSPPDSTRTPTSTPTVEPSLYLAPTGYPLEPETGTLIVTGLRGSRTLASGGRTVRQTSESLQLEIDSDAANSSGWNCGTHVKFESQPGVDWYIPQGTPVIATMDGTATLYVNTVANTFGFYGVDREAYLGNPDSNAAIDPFSGQPSGGKGVWVEVQSERFTVNAAHLDIGLTIKGIRPDAFLSGFSQTHDYSTIFGVPQAFTERTAVATWGVRRGDVIGYTGDSGYSEAPHLHYEVVRIGSTAKLCPTLEPGFTDSGWLANAVPNRP